jgi:hypothetical protein
MVWWRNICERLGACRDEQQQGDEGARWGQGCEGDDAADGVVNVREKEALACVVRRNHGAGGRRLLPRPPTEICDYGNAMRRKRTRYKSACREYDDLSVEC